MKDLRTPEEIDLDEKNISETPTFFSKLYNFVIVLLKYIHYAFMYKYHILFICLIITMIFPETIGYYISFVVNSFIKGYKNFK